MASVEADTLRSPSEPLPELNSAVSGSFVEKATLTDLHGSLYYHKWTFSLPPHAHAQDHTTPSNSTATFALGYNSSGGGDDVSHAKSPQFPTVC